MKLNPKQYLLVWIMLLTFLVEPILYLGIAFPLAKAATYTSKYTEDASCRSRVEAYLNFQTMTSILNSEGSSYLSEATEEEDLGDYSPIVDQINLSDQARLPYAPDSFKEKILDPAYIEEVILNYTNGTGQGMITMDNPADNFMGQKGDKLVFVCENAPKKLNFKNEDGSFTYPDLGSIFDPFFSYTPQVQQYLSILSDPNKKIGFKNPVDRYYVLGEYCPQFDPNYTGSGWSQDYNPCPNEVIGADGKSVTNFSGQYDNIANGEWDAPKVSYKVIATLAYLIAPTEEGGAGREYIRIKKIKDPTNNNDYTEADPVSIDNTEESDEAADTTTSLTNDEETNLDNLYTSSYKIDRTDPPYAPQSVAHAISIDQIDKVRVATQIVTKRLLGNNTTEYKVQAPFPVEVAWQTDAGLNQKSAPDFSSLSMIQSSRFLLNATVVEMLNELGLGDMDIDTSEMEINNFGDIAKVVGLSLLEQLLGSSSGSLKGWDLTSTMRSIGISYLEQRIGLVPGALGGDTNPLSNEGLPDYDNIVENIGRATVEYALGFPKRSLMSTTGTSAEIMENIGRTYLENQVFKVSSGTLTPSDGYPLKTVGDLIERLGEGRVEYVFKLPNQSMRQKKYADVRKSYKAQILFPAPSSSGEAGLKDNDWGMDDYISNSLSLAYTPYTYAVRNPDGSLTGAVVSADRTMYGFRQDDFQTPVIKLAGNPTEAQFTKFKQLVGSRTIETSVGLFSQGGTTNRTSLETLGNNDETPGENDYWIPTTNTAEETISIYGKPNNPNENPWNDRPSGGFTTYQLKVLNQPIWKTNVIDGDKEGAAENVNWCSKISKGLHRAPIFDGTNWDAAIDDLKDVIPNEPETAKRTGGRLGGDVFVSYSCKNIGAKAAQSMDAGLEQSFFDMLINPVSTTKTYFKNQDGAPNGSDFTGRNREWRFNLATLLYYNNPANYAVVDFNTIRSEVNLFNAQGQLPQTDATVGAYLDILTQISDADGLASRLSFIRNLYNNRKAGIGSTTGNLFDLTPLTAVNLTRAEINRGLAERYNSVAAYPSGEAGKFKAQYDNPDYNGWNFILSDLKSWLTCRANGGLYRFNSEGSAKECTGADTLHPDSNRIQAGLSLLEKNLSFTSYLNALSEALSSGTIQDPNYLENQPSSEASSAQSMAAAAASLSSDSYPIDGNGRIDTTKANFSGDLMRMLISPDREDNGPVKLTASIENYFMPYDNSSTIPTWCGDPSSPLYTDNQDLLWMCDPDSTLTPISEVGRNWAAKKFGNSDNLEERTFVAQLKQDFNALLKEAERAKTSIIDQADANLKRTGLDNGDLLTKGLLNGDFQRIFMLDDAKSVFERVGKEEIMRTIWERTGAAAQIKNSAQVQGILKELNTLAQKIEFYTSRLDNIRRNSESLEKVLGQMQANGNDLSAKLNTLGRQLTSARDKEGKLLLSIDNASNIQRRSREYEPYIQKVRDTISKAEASGIKLTAEYLQARILADNIIHDIQEIIAGKHLAKKTQSQEEVRDILTTLQTDSRSRDDTCFTATELINTFSGGKETAQQILTGRLTTLALRAGGCAVDESFGLPANSMYTWYILGKSEFPVMQTKLSDEDLQSIMDCHYPSEPTAEEADADYSLGIADEEYLWCSLPEGKSEPKNLDLFEKVTGADGKVSYKSKVPAWNKGSYNLNNFKLAVGITDLYKNKRTAPDYDHLVEDLNDYQLDGLTSVDQINAVASRGYRIIQNTVISKLLEMIPGFGRLMGRYRLNTKDFVAIMNGDMKPLISKVGGYFLDQALEMPRGTGQELIYPTCRDQVGNIVKCDKKNGAESDPDNIRTRILAALGLKKLGLMVPNFPTYFNFYGNGNLLENWGNASLSEYLRLDPNSFKGKISYDCYATNKPAGGDANNPIRCKNNQVTLLKAFSLDSLAFVTSITRLQERLTTKASDFLLGNYTTSPVGLEGARASAYYWFNTQVSDAIRNYLEELVFKKLLDSNSGYWKAFKGQDATAQAISLTGTDIVKTTALLNGLWQTAAATAPSDSSPVFAGENLQVIRRIILQAMQFLYPGWGDLTFKGTSRLLVDSETLPAPPSGGAQSDLYSTGEIRSDYLIQNYKNTLLIFKDRITTLNSEKGNFNPNKDLSWNGFLQGKIDASQIAKSSGMSDTVGAILGDALNRLIDSGSVPSWLKTIDRLFEMTTDAECGSGQRIGTFMAGLITGGGAGCLAHLGNLSLSDLLYSTSPEHKRLRSFFFERFLSHIFSAELEEKIGFQRGTFSRIVDNPKQARQILMYEGILMVANKAFGKASLNDTCRGRGNSPNSVLPPANCTRGTIVYALKEAFISGFCDNYDKNQVHIQRNMWGDIVSVSEKQINCSLRWDTRRSATTLTNILNKEIDLQLARIGRQYFGAEISRTDIDLLLHGDMRVFGYLALQYTANALNKTLRTTGAGRDRNAHYFFINYHYLRQAAGLPDKNLDNQAQLVGQRAYLETECMIIDGKTQSACQKMKYEDLLKLVNDNKDAIGYEESYLKKAGEREIERQRAERRKKALEITKYAMLDLIAFQADQSIPFDFSRRLLGSSETDRTQVIEEYLFNHLLDSKSPIGDFMLQVCGGDDARKNGTCWTFIEKTFEAITHRSQDNWKVLLEAQYSTYLGNLDRALTAEIGKLIGVDNLPDGLITGIAVWGTTGFSNAAFNKEEIEFTVGGKTMTGKPVGRILQEWGISRITNWADKQFGFKAGTALKIVKLSQDIINLVKLQQQIAFFNNLSKVGGLFGLVGEAGKQAALAQATKLAKSISSAVSEILVDFYSEEFSKIDQQLELPSGLTSLLAGAAITYAVYSIGQAAGLSGFGGSAASAAFGPAFFIALGFVVIFGPTKVVVTNLASADGYYPFYSRRDTAIAAYNPTDPNYYDQIDQALNNGPACPGSTASAFGGCTAEKPYSQYVRNPEDAAIYEFDPTKSSSYRAGLKRAARTKIQGLLMNLAKMPYSDWSFNYGFHDFTTIQETNSDGVTSTTQIEVLNQDHNLWIPQLMTLGTSEFNPISENESLSNYLWLPAPYTNQSGQRLSWGYGSPDERCLEFYSYGENGFQCKRKYNFKDGFWPIDKTDRAFNQVFDSIHIRL